VAEVVAHLLIEWGLYDRLRQAREQATPADRLGPSVQARCTSRLQLWRAIRTPSTSSVNLHMTPLGRETEGAEGTPMSVASASRGPGCGWSPQQARLVGRDPYSGLA
jgi:hypothetical protein